MKRIISAILLIGFGRTELGCREPPPPEPERTVALTLRGLVGITGDTSELGTDSGDVSIVLREAACDGTVYTVARNVIRDFTANELRSQLVYAFNVLEAPNARYPLDLFVTAQFRAVDGKTCASGCNDAPLRLEGPESEYSVTLSLAAVAPELCPQ